MTTTEQQNNKVYLKGIITEDPLFSHDTFGEGFYECKLAVTRLSEVIDEIPVMISERLIEAGKLIAGDPLAIKGEFRSYNKIEGERNRLMLSVFVKEIYDNLETRDPNIIELTGFVVKPPVFRTTPFNKEITDLLIAVNRQFNKSDYIPAIVWGRHAHYAETLQTGDKVYIGGRIQSRIYMKKLDDATYEKRIAYEVSVNKISTDPIQSELNEKEEEEEDPK